MRSLSIYRTGSQLLAFGGGHIVFFWRERQRFLDAVAAFLSGESP